MTYFNILKSNKRFRKNATFFSTIVLISFSPFLGYAQLPTITTQAVTQITAITTTANANITDLGAVNK